MQRRSGSTVLEVVATARVRMIMFEARDIAPMTIARSIEFFPA